MRSNKITKKILTYLWIIFILVSFCISLVKIFRSDFRIGEYWENYYSIYSSDGSQMASMLKKENVNNIITLDNSVIHYNNISRMDTVPLDDILNRFNPLDPRLDPYMKGIGEIFSAQSGNNNFEIIYVEKNSLSIYKLYWIIYKQFRGEKIRWFLGGFDPVNLFSPLLLFALFLGFSLFFNRNKWISFVCLINWMPFVLFFGFPACAVAIVSFYLIYRNKIVLFIPILTILFYFYAYLTNNVSASLFIYYTIAIFSNFLIPWLGKGETVNYNSSGKWRSSRIRLRRPDHELFSPVKMIMPVQKKIHNNRLLPVTVLFSTFILVFLYLEKTPEYMVLPVWEEQNNLNWTLKNTAFLPLSEVGENNSVISPADYITHIAFQEGFLYGTKWEYPHSDKPVLYPLYTEEEDQFSKSYKILSDYSEKWFNDRISTLNNDNPAKLLFSTDTPGFVIKKSIPDNYQSFMLLKISFSMLLLLLLIFSNVKKYKSISFNVKKKLLRRNEQVA